MNIETLLDEAVERIRPYLPEDHEIDDVSWGDRIFQICIFDVAIFPGRMVDRFRFSIHADETEEETAARFEDAVKDYINSWR